MQTIMTGILVKNLEGKVLLVKQPKGSGLYEGLYHLPGGIVKSGDSIDAVVQHALYEKTGIQAGSLRRVIYDDAIIERDDHEKTLLLMLLYTGEYVTGELIQSDAYEELRWVSLSEIMSLPLSPSLQKLIAVIGKWKNKFIFTYGLAV